MPVFYFFQGAKVSILFVNRELFSRFLFVHLRKKPYLCTMIELNRHIEILLLSNDCVIVPELGGFMAHHVDARYDEQEHLFLPPLRTLGFNPQLKMNDSLLVQSYIEAYDISYPEAYRRIQSEVAELRQHLETEGMFELNGIGVLSINAEGNLLFEANPDPHALSLRSQFLRDAAPSGQGSHHQPEGSCTERREHHHHQDVVVAQRRCCSRCRRGLPDDQFAHLQQSDAYCRPAERLPPHQSWAAGRSDR